MKTLLYLTDLYYKANSRNYYEEDLYITSKLLPHFNLLIGHPRQAIQNIESADLIVFRNTGPVIYYKADFERFREAVIEKGVTSFNSFDGKADMQGKEYLLHLSENGFPVIPTIDKLEGLHRLGHCDQYIVKPKDGADSIGMEIMKKEDMPVRQPAGKLIQPYLDFLHEISFYYLNNKFQYALYAPDKTKRWELEEYQPTPSDLLFAQRFIDWDAMAHGIIRVDACRMRDGSLLLVELEDLNPFLSIDLLSISKREIFIHHFIDALQKL